MRKRLGLITTLAAANGGAAVMCPHVPWEVVALGYALIVFAALIGAYIDVRQSGGPK